MSCLKTPGRGGGGGNLYDSLYGEAPTRKGYLFQASAIQKGRDFTRRSVWKSEEICRLGLLKSQAEA